MDQGHKATAKKLKKLEKKLNAVYTDAYETVKNKLSNHLAKYAKKDKVMKAMVKSGQLTQEAYIEWRQGQITQTKAFRSLRDTLAADLSNANEIAAGIINNHTEDVYALNFNYGTYEVESGTRIDTSFALYDHSTVENLLKDDPQVIPRVSVNVPKDQQWNRKNITSAITAGILSGDSIPQIAQRLQGVTSMDQAQSVRAARTYTTAAENKGRVDSYKRAQSMGIKLHQQWLATVDTRTRPSHIALDGVKIEVGKKFPNGCRWPGDPKGKPEEIYNCFVGDTNVATDSDIVRTYKHEYSGELFTVKTASGIELTCTPNHPILTRRGWAKARALNKSDNLIVTFVGRNAFSGRNPHINHVPTRFDALHEALYKIGRKRTCKLGVDFHGDIPTSDVEIVAKERLLRDDRNASAGKRINKFLLKFPDSFASRFGHKLERFFRVRKAAFGFIRGGYKTLALFFVGLRHPEIHRLRPIALLDSGRVQPLKNHVAGDAKLIRECLDRFTGVIFADDITSIDICSGSAHVYNLQSENGYYFVGANIPQQKRKGNYIMAIAHNCRCTLIAALDKYEYEGDERAMNLPDGITFEEWQSWGVRSWEVTSTSK